MKCLGGQYDVVMGKNYLLEDLKDMVPDMLIDTAKTIGLTAASGVGAGAVTALLGADVKEAMLGAGLVSALAAWISSTMSTINIGSSGARTSIGGKLFSLYTVASLLASISAFPVMGAKVGAGTHKLSTLAINKLKPEHYIERPAEVEPMPVIDEIQIEK